MLNVSRAFHIVVLSAVLLTAVAIGQEPIVIGPNVQVSISHPDWEHYEVILAADPNNALNLLAGSMFFDPAKSTSRVVAYSSFDNGKTWKPSLEVGTEGGLHVDPSTEFGCDGSAYLVALKWARSRHPGQTLVYRSTEAGKNWLKPTVLPFSDREYVTVDCTSSKYRGNVYIHGNAVITTIDGNRESGIAVFGSADKGGTFFQKTFPPASGRSLSFQGNGIVLSDGTFVVPFTDFDTKEGENGGLLRVVRSHDGGRNFSKALTVSQRSWPFSPTSFAVDRSRGPFRDRIYAVWTDYRSGRSMILLAYSEEKGQTWSIPIIVSDSEPFSDGRKGPDDFMGAVAVNREGVVGVTWYDRRESTNNRDWWVRFAASFDGGETFLQSVKVSEAAFTHEWSKVRAVEFLSLGEGKSTVAINVNPTRAYYGGGDTAGLVADANGVFHALWIDNRTNIPQVWTAPITAKGSVVRNGAPEFQELEKITHMLTFEFADTQYDPKTNEISAKAYLVNKSDVTITGPVVVRVLKVWTQSEILNADNHITGKGATWDFSSLLKNKKVEPGAGTEGKRIRFRLLDRNDTRQSQKFIPTFFSLTVEVLGRHQGTAIPNKP